MDPRIAELVLRKCLGVRDDESVLVVTDTKMEASARRFLDAAVRMGLEASMVSMAPRTAHGEEPTRAVREALKSCDVAVLLTTCSLTHTLARREASDNHGVRIASMPGVDPSRLPALLDIDYDELHARCDTIARYLEGRHTVRLQSPAGTDLTFEIGDRTVYRDSGRLLDRGNFGNLPAGEVCLAPLEGTARGTLVVDGSLANSGKVGTPVMIRFVNGRAVEVGDPALEELLNRFGPDAFSLAEFGIGTNPRARINGNVIEDEKAIGTAHVAVGANGSMGGTIQIPVHIDMILRGAKVFVDGEPIPEEYLTAPKDEGVSVEDLKPVHLAEGETFKLLFEYSNDAQYILDIDTQQFVEFNPAFEQLTGYTRQEIFDKKLTAQTIVARESMSTYMLKRETRRYTPAERYDLKIKCKSGEKKPVEISVKRIKIGDHEFVMGAIRDLTARKRLQAEMWEKIEELGHANNRIYALTEKIRRVPEFAPSLLHVTDQDELLERAAEIFCARDGLSYEAVTFYLQQEDSLEPAFSTHSAKKRRRKVESDTKLARVFRGDIPPVVDEKEAFIPLKGRERNLGVLEVTFHPKEIEVIRGNERALKGYTDLLLTVSNMLGLLIENLELYAKVRRQATVDGLTGVFNRRFFDRRLEREFQRARRYGRNLSLLMIDLDYFKEINDTFGHREGDQVLVEVGQLLKSHTRDVDLVCRYGGDEFVILMPETPYDGAFSKGGTLREAVGSHLFENVLNDGREIKLSLSIGVSSYSPVIRTMDEFLQECDGALYTAKQKGRNNVFGCIPPEWDGSQQEPRA